jgi:hypothetical protein
MRVVKPETQPPARERIRVSKRRESRIEHPIAYAPVRFSQCLGSFLAPKVNFFFFLEFFLFLGEFRN